MPTARPDTAWQPAPAREFGRPDAYIAIALFVFSWLIASLYLPAFRAGGGTPQFYQSDFGPAVMSACGRGFVNVDARTIPPLAAFLDTRVNTFACSDLPARPAPAQLGLLPSVCRYLMLATAGVWRVTGVSWTSVDILLSAMFATAIAGGFLALRFAAGRTLAIIGSLLWAVSPMHLANLPHLRDYSKTPFFILTALAVALVVSERRTLWLFVCGALFGAVQGIGFGMRTDAILNFVPFLVALFAAGPRALADQLAAKIASAVAALAVFALVAYPIFGIYGSSDGLSKIALLGLTTPFDQPLSVRAAPYNFGGLYNDSYVASVVYGDWTRAHAGARDAEPSGAAFAKASRDYAFRLASAFPGDMLTRVTGSVVQTLNLPFSIAYGSAPTGVTNRLLVWLADLRLRLMLALIGTGPAVAGLLIVLIACSRLRDGLVSFALLIFLTAYPVIQFHGRHTFHLEFLVIAAFVWLASLAFRAGRQVVSGHWPPALAIARGTGLVIGLIAVLVLIVVAARLVQVPQARGLFDRYEHASTDALTLTAVHQANGQTLLSAAIFEAVDGRRVQQALLVADVSAALPCAHAPDELTIRYLQGGNRPPVDYDFSTRVALPATRSGGGATRVFFPAYAIDLGQGNSARFAGVEVTEAGASCVHLSRARGVDNAIWLDATLAPDWRQQPLYQRLYLGPVFPERVWLKIAHWWPAVAALG